MTRVDVVVPCYNYARYLERCVETMLNQRGVDVRVLIIDDCSKDDSAEIAAAIAARDPRVTFWRNEQNLGHIKTFNRGILDWVEADYYTLVSADDALTPGSLARAAAVLSAHPDVHLVYGMAVIIDDDDALPGIEDAAEATYQIISGRDFLKQSCEWGTPAASPCVLLRTSQQKALGGYCDKMIHTSDMEMWMRFATRGPVGIVRDPQGYYRWHGANMTLKHTSGAMRDARLRIFTCQYVYDTWNGADIPDFDLWLASLKQRLGREGLRRASAALEDGDTQAYGECRDFVREYAPELLNSPLAWRLSAQRAMGPAVSRAMRNAVQHLRKRNAGAGAQWFERNSTLGWWPEAAELEYPMEARS
ncbi:MAG TPA: glycosyltransferase family A protein [Caulobacterales bacterium]|nr:glycosyltransferase family A protein [Caulobacterales bacterium]